MKTFSYLLTPVEIQRLVEYAAKYPGKNIWVHNTPNGIGTNVVVSVQKPGSLDKTLDRKEISDLDSW
jgi:hypothetical protein